LTDWSNFYSKISQMEVMVPRAFFITSLDFFS
jgi:hypothetical protein